MSIKAMKQAYAVPLIEQLESVPTDARMMYEHDKFHHQNIPVGRLCHEAATALRQAIEQAEKQEPVIPAGVINAIRNVGLTLIKTSQGYVLQRIEGIKAQTATPVHASDISQERVDETAKDRHDLTCVCGAVWVGEEMVCSPRKLEWVGLTDEEFEEILKELSHDPRLLAVEIEARLTEKNI